MNKVVILVSLVCWCGEYQDRTAPLESDLAIGAREMEQGTTCNAPVLKNWAKRLYLRQGSLTSEDGIANLPVHHTIHCSSARLVATVPKFHRKWQIYDTG
jgi:hypothetical protein